VRSWDELHDCRRGVKRACWSLPSCLSLCFSCLPGYSPLVAMAGVRCCAQVEDPRQPRRRSSNLTSIREYADFDTVFAVISICC
jgi:hypothetical protein